MQYLQLFQNGFHFLFETENNIETTYDYLHKLNKYCKGQVQIWDRSVSIRFKMDFSILRYDFVLNEGDNNYLY